MNVLALMLGAIATRRQPEYGFVRNSTASAVAGGRFATTALSAPPEQAETMPWHGPSSLKRMDTAAAAALLIISGTESGGTFFGPPSISSSLPRSSVPMPPMPVPRMDAMRSPS
jgi:hypothetical protein